MTTKNNAPRARNTAKAAPVQPQTIHRVEGSDNGDDARGTANSRANANETTHSTGSETNVVPIRAANTFFGTAAALKADVAAKVQGMGTSRQALANAADLYAKGGDATKEADRIVAKAAVSLYEMLVGDPDNDVAPVLTNDELNATLGDIFGYQVKGDAKRKFEAGNAGDQPSKTPFGQGEAIRKRIIRLQQATQHVRGGDGGRTFQDSAGNPLPLDATTAKPKDGKGPEPMTVSDILSAVKTGNMPFWNAYERLAQVKRDNAARIEPAFNAKNVNRMVETLSAEGAIEVFKSDVELQKAYDALGNMLGIIAEAVKASEAKANAA